MVSDRQVAIAGWFTCAVLNAKLHYIEAGELTVEEACQRARQVLISSDSAYALMSLRDGLEGLMAASPPVVAGACLSVHLMEGTA